MKKALLFTCFLFVQFALSQETWTLIQAGEDIYNGQLNGGEWPGRWDIESLDMKPVTGGFVTCGYYNDEIFDSTDGNSYDLSGKSGAYLVRYNNQGVLQWLVRTVKTQDEERNLMMSIAIDSQDNIYVIGKSDGKLYDTTGSMQQIAPQWPEGGSSAFLMKFNKNGKFLWKTLIVGVDPKRVAVDNDDNVVVAGSFWGQDSAQMLFNDQYVGEWTNITDDEVHYYIAKYNSDGMPLWDAGILIDSVNREFINGITFDEDNNLYVNGVYEMKLKVYDADEEDFIERNWSGNYGGSMFIAKYTPDGDAQWVVNSDDTNMSSIVTASDGSNYIAGNNTVHNGNGEHFMTNADGTEISQSTYGPFYVAKINPDGTWGWLTGSTGTGRGYAAQMLKYDDKISVVGSLDNFEDGLFDGKIHGVNNAVEVDIHKSDVFIATYTLDGNLHSVSRSADIDDRYAINGTSGFMRDDEGFLYIQRNMMGFVDNVEKEFYGQMIAPINGTDATITKFKESDGDMLYLSVDKVNRSNVYLTPNPTNKDFVIGLNDYSNAKVVVTDVSGKIVFEKSYSYEKELIAEIDGSSGIYFVKVTLGERIEHFKVLKK